MAKIVGSKCKLCRRAGEKLFIKGDRCASPKCAMVRKAYGPGVHGPIGSGKHSISEFGRQLAQKQKIKRIYGISERQLRKHLDEAKIQKGVVGDNLIARLEMRFDNVVYRMGMTLSRTAARQLVSHSHFLVNGKILNIPSAWLKVGDIISVKPTKQQSSKFFKDLKIILKKGGKTPGWVSFDSEKLEGKIVAKPTRNEIGTVLDVQSVIEFYSR